jgi:rare lipoprotein A
MANGERFNMHDPSIVAHRSLPFGTRLRITNLTNGKSIRAVVKDRGPFVHGRCVDLSRSGAAQLGYLGTGTTTVSVQVIR